MMRCRNDTRGFQEKVELDMDTARVIYFSKYNINKNINA